MLRAIDPEFNVLYRDIHLQGVEVMRTSSEEARDPHSDAIIYVRYTPNTLIIDVRGVGLRVVHVPDLHEVAPHLEGKMVSARRTVIGRPNIEEVHKEYDRRRCI